VRKAVPSKVAPDIGLGKDQALVGGTQKAFRSSSAR